MQKWIGLAAYFQATTSATVTAVLSSWESQHRGYPPNATFLPRKRRPFLEDYEAQPQIRPAIKLVIVDLALGSKGSMGFGFLGGLLVTFNYDFCQEDTVESLGTIPVYEVHALFVGANRVAQFGKHNMMQRFGASISTS